MVVDEDEFGLDVPTLTAALAAEGIDSRHYYYPPIHQQKAYAGERPAGPAGDRRPQPRVITPPLWSSMMTADDVGRLADLVVAMHENAGRIARSRRVTSTARHRR